MRSQAGTQTTYDGLGRTLTVEDPLSETTSASYQVECGWTSPADAACYQAITVHDALHASDLFPRRWAGAGRL